MSGISYPCSFDANKTMIGILESAIEYLPTRTTLEKHAFAGSLTSIRPITGRYISSGMIHMMNVNMIHQKRIASFKAKRVR